MDDLADAGADQYTFHLEATSKFTSLVPRSPDVVPRPGFHGLQRNQSLYCSLIPSSSTGCGYLVGDPEHNTVTVIDTCYQFKYWWWVAGG